MAAKDLVPTPADQPTTKPNYFGGYGHIPTLTGNMTFGELGNSGLRAFGGYVREEFLPQLQGRSAMTVYREMSDNSPIIGGLLWAINSTMRKVEWRVVPADDTPAAQEMADFADSLRLDMNDTWEDTITEGLSMLVYGFAPQEIVYKKRLGRDPGMDPRRPGKMLPKSKFDDGRIGWHRLPIRGQDTIIKWFFDENGDALGMTQQPYVGTLVDIPMEKLLLFRPSHHKNNPEGRSILRNAYRSYYMVKRIEEQEAILYERMNGIPVIRVPASLMEQAANGDAVAISAMQTFKAMAVNLRIDEQMGLVLPSDPHMGANGVASTVSQYSFELISPGGGKGGSGSVSGADTITRHQNNMLMSTLADFISLGHGATGTQALSVDKTDMFFQGIEGYLNGMAAIYNDHGLARLWELNALDPDLMPSYVPDLAKRLDLDILGNYVNRLAVSGMAMFPNAELEAALLDAAGLPDVEDAGLDLLPPEEQPVAIAGPNAAAATAALVPEPAAPAAGSPKDKFEKMIMGSLARRMIKRAGPRFPITTG